MLFIYASPWAICCCRDIEPRANGSLLRSLVCVVGLFAIQHLSYGLKCFAA